MEFTHKELLQVPCIRCNAAVGQPCVAPGNRRTPIIGFHKQRNELRTKCPMLEMDHQLDSSEKALVIGYALLMLADACEANSEKLFGKFFSSREIQRFFASKAIDELKLDGLIGKVERIPMKGAPPDCTEHENQDGVFCDSCIAVRTFYDKLEKVTEIKQ